MHLKLRSREISQFWPLAAIPSPRLSATAVMSEPSTGAVAGAAAAAAAAAAPAVTLAAPPAVPLVHVFTQNLSALLPGTTDQPNQQQPLHLRTLSGRSMCRC